MVKTDIDNKGNRVTWEVELSEYSNFIHSDMIHHWERFYTKKDAQEWIQERIMQRLVFFIKVFRLTYDNVNNPMLPTRKIMMKKLSYDSIYNPN